MSPTPSNKRGLTNTKPYNSQQLPENRPNWRKSYKSILWGLDFFILLIVFFSLLVLTNTNLSQSFSIYPDKSAVDEMTYLLILPLMLVVWLLLLELIGSRNSQVIGGGSREYSLVIYSSVFAFSLFSAFFFALNASFSRFYLFGLFLMGTPLLVFARWVARRFLNSRRLSSGWRDKAIIIGEPFEVKQQILELEKRFQIGLQPMSVCLIGKSSDQDFLFINDTFGKLPNIGGIKNLERHLRSTNVRSVLLVESGGVSSEIAREISWQLDSTKHELILSPGFVNITGPRIHTRPVAGMPLLYVEVPSFRGTKRAIKRVLDIFLSAIAIVLLFPIFLIIALGIKLDSKGPVLFKQSRVGLAGRIFLIYKFRSMRVDAEKEKDSLVKSERIQSDSPLFKMKSDPRVTRFGSFLRKWSLDELPQFINVLRGQMSLVGPRPPLPEEVEVYDPHVHRKFLVKPGITGLWQISGRSNLSWDESVRLDLYYVENWSIIGDAMILLRTFSSVLHKEGAY